MEKVKMINIKELAKGRKDVYTVDPAILKEKEGFNVRQNMVGIEELADNIYENGQLRAIDVYREPDDPDHLYVVDGARRRRALMVLVGRGVDVLAKVSLIPNKEAMIFNLVNCNDGMPLTMLEQGMVFLRARKFGYEVADIAKKTTKSLPYIYNAIRLAETPHKVQQMMIDGVVPDSTVLIALQNTNNEEELIKILTDAVDQAKIAGGGNIKRGAVTHAVSQGVGKPRISMVKKLQEIDGFVEENSTILNGNKGLEAVKAVTKFMRGEITLDEILSVIQ